MDNVQAALGTAILQSSMNLQGNMAAAVISGSTGNPPQGQDQAMQAARSAGLAAQGVGTRLDVVA
jgi:hypothetical protein